MRLWLCLLMICVAPLALAANWSRDLPAYSQHYDEKRQPLDDLAAARLTAASSQRHILLMIGGDWSRWSLQLDNFIDARPALTRALRERFVIVRVNVSAQNPNQAFLRNYPAVASVPHLMVLDKQGNLLGMLQTDRLEAGSDYDEAQLLAGFERLLAL